MDQENEKKDIYIYLYLTTFRKVIYTQRFSVILLKGNNLWEFLLDFLYIEPWKGATLWE